MQTQYTGPMKLYAQGVLLLGLVACGGNKGTGDDAPGDVDGGPGGACTSAAECPAEAPVCSATGVCVQCETSEQCPAELPVCANQTCTAACAGDEVSADFVTIPSDIIWVVDQSGSMDQETAYVQTKINDFAAQISATSIDYHVVMIAITSGSNAICVPAPLGGANCGNNTRFRLVNQRIASNDGPSKAISTYAQYADFLRPDAIKHFVFVTDDESSMSAVNFTNGLAALMPTGMFDNFKVHAIYAYGNGQSNGCTGAFGTGADEGTVYTTLVAQTGGARGVICEDDWTQVFTDISAAVVSGSQVSCELTIPAPPANETLDPTKVNVRYQMGGVAPGQLLPQVPTAADCGATGGWYYDDNTAPTTITLCGATCSSIQADAAANVKIEFGCSTQIL